MAKKAYIGVDNVARKIKKGYIGVAGVAKRIKKAYIGIGGVARPCWGNGIPSYYGEITSLSSPRRFLAATSLGNYALFGGGEEDYNTAMSDVVDVYNKALTRTNAPPLSVARIYFAATSVDNYALFGGGYASSDMVSAVDAYNKSFTRINAFPLNDARQRLAATSIGGYALFGGGNTYSDRPHSSTVDVYTNSLTKIEATPLKVARYWLAATSVGNYALFAGGRDDYSNQSLPFEGTVDAYDKSLTKVNADIKISARSSLAATTVGNYALFGGGIHIHQGPNVKDMDAIDVSLTVIGAPSLNWGKSDLAATTVDGYAMFGGGDITIPSGVIGDYYVVDVYDESLTKPVRPSLEGYRSSLAAASVGSYALFAGGHSRRDTVEAIVVN